MKNNILAIAVASALTASMSIGAAATEISDNGNTKSVGPVVWHNQANVNASELMNRAIPEGSTSLFFIRRSDDDPIETSVNLGVNERFLVSLHPGSYTQVYSCAGIHRISAEITGLKINDLLQNANEFNLPADGMYFFYVDVEPSTGETSISQITKDSAIPILENKRYQNHQVSRVVPNCPEPVQEPIVVTVPPPVIVIDQPQVTVTQPVLEQQVSIELEVLFDHDKSTIKPMYFSEISEVADFMNRYSNTTAIIEGHTDSTGNSNYNQGLSERRAMSVKQALVQRHGIDPNRLTVRGYGESRPVASNSTASGRQQNRRVIAVIEEK